ncbi:MAG: toll/interleukin-1 receptor domain-containing protein, partial [Vitreimonas sp.]
MADIFVSYSRLDHDRVKPIAERLGSLGYSVWWEARDENASAEEVENALDSAHAVLAVWGVNALNSSWVYAEAARALDTGKLAQARIDDIELPLPFNAAACADLSGTRSEWGPIEDTL